MILSNTFNFIDTFIEKLNNKIKNLYYHSNYYDKKISNSIKFSLQTWSTSSFFNYKISKKNLKLRFYDDIWHNKNICDKDYKNLNNFNWFSLDLKSSKTIHKVITNWINNNFKYNRKSLDFDLTQKIIWLSYHNLSYDDVNKVQKNFNMIIQKQLIIC